MRLCKVYNSLTFKVLVDDRIQSVSAELDQNNYSIAISAHEARNPVVVHGNLKVVGQRWHVTSAIVRELIGNEDDEDDLPK